MKLASSEFHDELWRKNCTLDSVFYLLGNEATIQLGIIFQKKEELWTGTDQHKS